MKYITLFLVLISLWACEQKEEEPLRKDGFTPILKTKEDTLFYEVMQGHDIGMAKMGRISKYIRQSEQMIDSLKKLPGKAANKKMISDFENLKLQLQEADDDMSNWMMNFRADSLEGKPERIGYLEKEKIKVEKVRVKIMDAVAAGDSLLAKPK